jgi:hypothetical protein
VPGAPSPGSAVAGEPGPASWPGKAPRQNDRPEKRDTCERRSGLASVHGRAGNDRIYGGSVAYRMFGDEDRDFLLGSSDDDEIDGGDDGDVLIGGGGADLFVYDTQFASLPNRSGRWSPETGDTIVDFRDEERDRIDLTRMRKYGVNAPATLQWSGTDPMPYSVWTLPRDGDTVVAMDLDGDSEADAAIRLLGEIRLSESSFCGVEAEEA